MQAVSLSYFRFDGAAARAWAFSQMPLARRPLRALPAIGFIKQFGTGTREGFHPVPNLGVYAIMAAWPSLDHARAQVNDSSVFQRYRDHASENFNVYIRAISARGEWDATQPFAVENASETPLPMAVLTRATVKPRHVIPFWTRTPNIEADVRDQTHLLFKCGMGEVPWFQQVTFSIWDDVAAMKAFAFAKTGFHSQAVKNVRENGWFKEELYARFRVLAHDGTWEARDPLARTRAAPSATRDMAPVSAL
ncbi:MAG: spheroidene monooxygenase [Pseudomonadota bacterium]